MTTNQQAWKIYEAYVEAWKPISEEERAGILAEVFADNVQYFTPEFKGGREAALKDIAGFQKKFPGAHFEVEDVSSHHDVALLTWVLVQADGSVLVKGHDQIRISPQGKITSLITFPPSVSKP